MNGEKKRLKRALLAGARRLGENVPTSITSTSSRSRTGTREPAWPAPSGPWPRPSTPPRRFPGLETARTAADSALMGAGKPGPSPADSSRASRKSWSGRSG
ncbi:MAG: hypothetical protein MZU79_00315 [Anaerotruncus sp.]|nr:hypothetical protein [Anaerotruncus sp.]